MTVASWVLVVVVVIGLVSTAILWWWARGWKRTAIRESADNTLQDISDTYERVLEEVIKDSDEEAVSRLRENLRKP